MAGDDRHGGEDDLLKGWKDIARHLHASERTVQRWEQTLSLPVRRAGPQHGSMVFATRTELRAWLETKQGAEATRDGDAAEAPPVDAAVPPAPTSRSDRWRLWAGLAAVGLALVGVGLWYAGAFQIRQRSLPAPKPLPSTLLLRLTSADGTWSIVGIPVGGTVMSTRVGNSALVLSAVRDGDVSRIHVSTVAQGAGGRVEALTPAVVLALRQGEAVTPTDVPGLAKVEWLADTEFSDLAPRPTGPVR